VSSHARTLRSPPPALFLAARRTTNRSSQGMPAADTLTVRRRWKENGGILPWLADEHHHNPAVGRQSSWVTCERGSAEFRR
jgi:hypothetical protein